MTTLKAEKRDMAVKAKKLRREGFVTGNVFGKKIERSIPVMFARKEAEALLRTKNKGSQLTLDVDGVNYDVLIKEISYDSMKNQIDDIEFQALVKGEKVHSVAELVFVNHEKVTAGVLQEQLHEIPYKALPKDLVEKINVDVSNMRIGDVIKVKDLAIASDKEVELLIDPEENVVILTEAHNAPVEEEATEETANA